MMQSSQAALPHQTPASQQPPPHPTHPPPSPSPQLFQTLPPGPSPPPHTPEPPYPPASVPSGLPHLGTIPPGHYSAGQIPFLGPPPGVYSVLVMANISIPNLTLGIPVWYLTPPTATPPGHPKPYIAMTPMQPIPVAPSTATVPLAPPQDHPHAASAMGKKRKTRKGASKDKATAPDPTPLPPTKPCALCDGIGHATHTCPELPRIQPMDRVMFPESSAPETSSSSSSIAKNPKTLHTNKPCALCGVHGHYSHHFPHLTHYRASLEVIHE